ncbi:cytosolic sulfotransferase 15-like [Populus alba x Populus x berolinensis]|uniref:Sulfotransferase n=1 Tax=Populus alba x Populus x berolinensis TaxID=444605 RepID=A0AAD6R9X4_9ROSI|nr:cytosolic sulfotransferase 15-like [Populus alba x Populus x berolinensis]
MITENNNLAETDEIADLLSSLPKEKSWRSGYVYRYQGFWCPEKQIPAVIAFQKHFLAQKTDTILVTMPKSGTTWLKALAFSVMNRAKYTPSCSPLNSVNPHDLVPFSLPDSIKNSGCRIVCLCRNPFDNFISLWHFACKARPERLGPLLLEEAFDSFCNGLGGFGPFFDHVLGYWRESLERPEEVLFLTYEDMKEDINSQMKRLAEFLGCPFSLEEEADGVVEGITKLCGFSNLKDKEINKTGRSLLYFENKTLFRRGEVGDWVNYLSPEMVDRLNKLMEQKLAGSGLKFKTGL